MIIINVYDDFIMCSAKCGSRYLDVNWENKRRIIASLLPLETFTTKYIVVREPHGHLITALHTDLLHIWNDGWPGITEEHVINKMAGEGGGHYSLSLYQWIYEYWVKTNKFAKVIDISELTPLIEENGLISHYDKDEYDWHYFDIWKTKEEIEEYVKNTYPTEYQIMMDRLVKEKEYYNMLIKN